MLTSKERAEIAAFIERVALQCDAWAKESRTGGWSTHQVQANTALADQFRRYAAQLRSGRLTASSRLTTKGNEMSEWRPIESAPKDGTPILGWSCEHCDTKIWRWDGQPHHRSPRPYFRADGWLGTKWSRENQPTHWMPLPPAPPARAGH